MRTVERVVLNALEKGIAALPPDYCAPSAIPSGIVFGEADPPTPSVLIHAASMTFRATCHAEALA